MAPAPEVSIPGTELRSVRMPGTDREYRLLIGHPIGPAPGGGFPVIYQLDANAGFGTLVESIRMRSRRPDATGIEPAVTVGIGYPRTDLYDHDRRVLDYTRAAADGSPGDLGRVGGAERFRDFVVEQVVPAIDRSFPTDRGRQMLIGHSLAGRLAVEWMLRSWGTFTGFLAISPSLWWDRSALLSLLEAGPVERDGAPIRLMVTVGEYEERPAPWHRAASGDPEVIARRKERAMVSRARRLAAQVEGAWKGGCSVRFREFAGEDHASVVLPSLSAGLRFLLSGQ